MMNLFGNEFDLTRLARLLPKINEALLLASDEYEILAAVSLYADKDGSLHLFYLDWGKAASLDGYITKVAEWHNGTRSYSEEWEPPFASQDYADLSGFISILADFRDPVWLVEDLGMTFGPTGVPRVFAESSSLAAIKLHNLGYTGADHYHTWDSLICIAWPTPHTFSPEERYGLVAISQFASSVVSNHRMHKQILADNVRLQDLDRLKDDFLYCMSHELRTPLASIITLSEAILSGADGEIGTALRDDIDCIHDSGQHLLSMITEILDFAKFEAGIIQFDRQPTDVLPLIRRAVRKIEPLIEQQNKDMRVDIASQTDLPMIWVDPTRSYQVLLNLLSNAVKFSNEGCIEISVSEEQEVLVVCVRDEGIGIPVEQHPIIFEKFRQVNGSLTRKTGGTGLGLAICKQLVELQGGQIWLRSTPGRGSSFYFSVPIYREQTNEAPIH